MTCRYCGMEIKSVAQKLRNVYGEKCKSSTSGKHVAISTGEFCIYCGEKVKSDGRFLRSQYSDRCLSSPTARHALQ